MRFLDKTWFGWVSHVIIFSPDFHEIAGFVAVRCIALCSSRITGIIRLLPMLLVMVAMATSTYVQRIAHRGFTKCHMSVTRYDVTRPCAHDWLAYTD